MRELRLSGVREFDQNQWLEDGRTGFEYIFALGCLSTDRCGFRDIDKAALASWSKIISPGLSLPDFRLPLDLLVYCMSYQLEVSSVRAGILVFIFTVVFV